MDGVPHVHGLVRPIPLHCQRPAQIDSVLLPPTLPLPAMGLDFRRSLKPPFPTAVNSLAHTALTETAISFQAASRKDTVFHDTSKKGTLFHPVPEKESVCYVASEKDRLLRCTLEKANPCPVPSFSMTTPFDCAPDKIIPFCTSTDKFTGMLAPFPSFPHPLTLYQQLRLHPHNHLMTSDLILPKTSLVFPLGSPSIPANPTLLLPSCTLETAVRGPCADTLTVSGYFPMTLSESSLPATSPYGRKVFPCPECRYATDRRNNLKRHMLTMHQLSAKLLECCGVLFRTKAALREHALVFHYHGYSCFYCGRRFCRKALLKRHLTVHSGQKEFLCNMCDYATSHKSNLERHRRVHVRQDMEEDLSPRGEPSRCDRVGSFSNGVQLNSSVSSSRVDCISFEDLSSEEEEEEEEEIDVHGD